MFNSTKEPKSIITNDVRTTTDYFLFITLDGNRNTNKAHIKRLKESISQNLLFTVIIVNEKYEIIDGQHRFEVIKELGLPLNYIICKGYGLAEVQMLNQNSKNWGPNDFLECYCNLDLRDYDLFKIFKNRYEFGHIESLVILSGTRNTGASLTNSFKDGLFKIKNFGESCEIADKIQKISKYYDGYKRRSFVFAMLRLFDNPNFDLNYFLNKLETQSTKLVDCVNAESYISLIEEIYNYRSRDKINLRF